MRLEKTWNERGEKEMVPGDGIKRICAWCQKTMAEGREPASHTICPDCAEGVVQEINAFDLRAQTG